MEMRVSPSVKTNIDILLLQGPVGGFFIDLQAEFEKRGFKTCRIAFDKADLLGNKQKNTLRFQGNKYVWPLFFEKMLQKLKPEFIVLFGDSRPHHAIAIQIAKQYGVKIFSLEEGYFRPGFIAVENNGNNANSPLKYAGLYGENRTVIPSPVLVPSARFEKYQAAITRYVINAFMGKNEQSLSLIHRPRCLLNEAISWLQNGLIYCLSHQKDLNTIKYLHKSYQNHYIIVALQVHDDAQIIQHGKGWCAEKLIDETLLSFKNHAPDHLRLVFKVHPLDRGHFPYARLIKRKARQLNINNLIDIVQTGALGTLCRHANGLITVNSTGGMVALNHGKPVLTLGDCLYNRAGITFEGSLDEFWTKALPPDPHLWRSLKGKIFSESLVSGCFYAKNVREKTINNTIDRIVKRAL